MGTGLRIAILSGIAATFMAGCAQQKLSSLPDNVDLQPTANGEKCIGGASPYPLPEMPDSRFYRIRCGTWTEDQRGRLFVTQGDDPAIAARWWELISQRLTCNRNQAEQADLPGGQRITRHQCTYTGTTFPYTVVQASIGNHTYMGDAVGSATPQLYELIGQLLRSDATASNADMLQVARLELSRPISTDQGNQGIEYLAKLRSGRRFMSMERYAEAEQAFAIAYNLYRGKDAAQQNADLLHSLLPLALARSSQGDPNKMEQAQKDLEEAEGIAKKYGENIQQGVIYAMNLANQIRDADSEESRNKIIKNIQDKIDIAKKYYEQESFNERQRRKVAGESTNESLVRLNRERDRVPISLSLETQPQADRLFRLEEDKQTVLYLEAEILRRQALRIRNAESPERRALLDRARQALSAPPALDPGQTLTDEIAGLSNRTGGLVLDGLGNRPGALSILNLAVDDFGRLHNRKERPYGVTLLQRAAIRLGADGVATDEQAAIADFKAGVDVLRSAQQFAKREMIEPYLSLLYRHYTSAGQRRPDLAADMLAALQVIDNPDADTDITAAAGRLASGPVKGDIEKAESLTAELIELDRQERVIRSQPKDRSTQAQLDKITEQINTKTTEIGNIQRSIISRFPGYRVLLTESADPALLQAVIQPGEAVATFFVGPNGTYGFLISAKDIKVWHTDLKPTRLKALVQEIRTSLEPWYEPSPVPGGGMERFLPPFAAGAAHDLYLALFGADDNRLTGVNNLLTVVSGPLASLPMGILVTNKPAPPRDGEDWTMAELPQMQWLVQRAAITHFPSLQAIVSLRLNSIPQDGAKQDGAPPEMSTPSKPYIGFADAVWPDAATSSGLASAECGTDTKMPTVLKLEGTKQEIEAVGDSLGADPLDIVTGENFTVGRLTGAALKEYRVIHFATHAFLADEMPCVRQPAIQISMPPDATKLSQGLLGRDEVEKMSLNADLVVLSACNTARPEGKQDGKAKQEGLSGLARAFFHAGARGMLITHWSANNEAASRLTTALFPLSDGQSVAMALAAAQNNMRDTAGTEPDRPSYMIHPFFWGVFALVGDGRSSPPNS